MVCAGATVIIVFVSHLEVILPIPHLAVVPGGTVSLDSFFVLSGFLITSLMLREQMRTDRVNTAWFYRRRALRLLPPLFFMLALYMVFAYLSRVSWHLEWTSLLSVVFYYSNWKLALHSNALGGIIAPGLQHVWSLSLEEQFYIVWPWVTIFVLNYRRSLRTVVLVLVSLIVLIGVHRGLSYTGPNSWYSDFVRTDTRSDGILLGCLMAHIWMRRREPVRGVNIAATVATIFLLICLPLVNTESPFLFDGGITAIDLACAALILALVQGNWLGRHFFRLRPFVILGTVSYAFYLFHLPVFFAIRYWGEGWNPVVRVAVAIAATLALTTFSWFALEKPALNLKDRLEGRSKTSRLSLNSMSGGLLVDPTTSPIVRSEAATDPPAVSSEAATDPPAVTSEAATDPSAVHGEAATEPAPVHSEAGSDPPVVAHSQMSSDSSVSHGKTATDTESGKS